MRAQSTDGLGRYFLAGSQAADSSERLGTEDVRIPQWSAHRVESHDAQQGVDMFRQYGFIRAGRLDGQSSRAIRLDEREGVAELQAFDF